MRTDHVCRSSDSKLIIPLSREMMFANLNIVPVHVKWLPIKVQVRNMKETMHLFYTLSALVLSPICDIQCTIRHDLTSSERLVVHLIKLRLDSGPGTRRPRRIVGGEEYQIIFNHEINWILMPHLGRKGIRIVPQHVLVRFEHLFMPNMLGAEFRHSTVRNGHDESTFPDAMIPRDISRSIGIIRAVQ
jgi:hypothetical protein